MFYHVAIKSDGSLWAWGFNDYGQLGDGTTTYRYSLVQIGTDTDWNDVRAGYSFTIAIKQNGAIYTTGANCYGQLGLGIYGEAMNKATPTQVP